MNASDYYDWKKNPVTQVMLTELSRRYELLKEELVEQASSVSQVELAEKAGGAKAYRDILNMSFDEIFDEETHGY